MTSGTKTKKPKKPYKTFPLTPHNSGSWCKKINNKIWHFGRWDDPMGALEQFEAEVADIRAGRDPRRGMDSRLRVASEITVADLVNAFLLQQRQRLDEGEISCGEWRSLRDSGAIMVNFFGRVMTAASLRPADFSSLKKTFTGWGPNTTSNHIRRMKTPFFWAYKMELIEQVPNFGPEFVRSQKRKVRKAERERRAEHGKKFYTSEQVRDILNHTDSWLRASVLLGINGGFENSECGRIKWQHIDFETGIYDLPRGKTFVERLLWLWPETIEAIQYAMTQRGVAKNDEDDKLCFLTSHGKPVWWETDKSRRDNVGPAFNKITKQLGIHKPGHSFYSLRRTFETIAGDARDQVIVDLAMGHEGREMAALYRQGVDPQRLIDVSQHVRDWLFADK